MDVFGDYSAYYNLLYNDKDYSGEADFIEVLLKKYAPGTESILDLGCGTGRHDFILSEMGYSVTGIDLSEKMISIAEANTKNHVIDGVQPSFIQGNIQNINIEKKFDLIVSLFHVMSYQQNYTEFQSVINTVNNHLKPGGIFIFDFWFGPAVLSEKPSIRIKKKENDNFKIIRIAEPDINPEENIVNVNYTTNVIEKNTSRISEIKETHKMRYWFIPEIIHMIEQTSFTILDIKEWMTDNQPALDTWNVYCVTKKN